MSWVGKRRETFGTRKMLMPRAHPYGEMRRSRLQPNDILPEPQQNHLLAALSPAAQRRLFPHLELVPLELQSLINQSGRSGRHVYFPTDSIISMHYVLEDGKLTAISVVGNEGLLGITLFLGFTQPLYRSVVQSAGYAFRVPRSRVEEEFRRYGEFHELMLRYMQVLITQLSQTAVCNRHHSID